MHVGKRNCVAEAFLAMHVILCALDSSCALENFCNVMIRSRLKRNNDSGIGDSQKSPMHEVEPIIVDYCIKLARMGSPLNRDQVELLARDIIAGTPTEQRMLAFKKQRKLAGNTVIGGRWYYQFMKRHSNTIKAVRTRTSDSKRIQYITRENFQTMYDCVYERMVEGGVAIKHEEPIMYDARGEITSDPALCAGKESFYELIAPNNVLLVDETGCNTNQKDDGPIGKEKMIVPTDGSCNGRNGSVADQHYTTLVFQTANGEPVCCCIILKSAGKREDMPLNWVLGIDVTAAAAEDDEIISKASNVCRGGPACHFRGKRISAFVSCSPNASITSDILADCLAHIDSFNVFRRDGHHSRFELPFLQYIHDNNKWTACIGVPYATHWWQVADSSEVNGAYKMETT